MILAVINWTAILAGGVTGATAIFVAWFGYLGAKLGSRATREQVAIEDRRAREERERADRERRREVYAEFVRTERDLFTLLAEHGRTTAALENWSNRVTLALAPVILIAPTHVATAAAALQRAVRQIRRDAEKIAKRAKLDADDEEAVDDESAQKRTDFSALAKEWRKRQRQLIDEMRKDVAPDAAPIEWADVKLNPPK